MHSSAILELYINIPKSSRICMESAYSLNKRSQNQEDHRSHVKATFISPSKAPLTTQIDARSLPNPVPSLSKTFPRPFDA